MLWLLWLLLFLLLWLLLLLLLLLLMMMCRCYRLQQASSTVSCHWSTSGSTSHWRDCHFDDTPCLSILKHLIKVQGGVIK